MRDWILAGAARMTVALTVAATAPCFAAPPQPQTHPALGAAKPVPGAFDPADVYFQAWLNVRDSETLEKEKDFAGALDKLKSAQELFGSISTYHPEWKSQMVKDRQSSTTETIGRLGPLANEQKKKNREAIAELEGAPVRPGELQPSKTGPAIAPAAPNISPLEAQRLKNLQDEVARLRAQMGSTAAPQTPGDTAEASRNISRIQDLQRQRSSLEAQLAQTRQELSATRDRLSQASANAAQSARESQRIAELQRSVDNLEAQLQQARGQAARSYGEAMQNEALAARLRQAETDLAATRARLAAAPVQSELDGMNRRIDELEKEREAMGLALTQSRSEQLQAKAKIATLETDLKIINQQRSDLERNLTTERSVANDVVLGQQTQLKKLGDQLVAKDKELAAAHNRIGSLEHELEETKQSFAELRDERDGLLKQRDQMTALLNMDKAGRVQELIEQNMSLHRDLREANEKVAHLQANGDENNDALTEALRDLAIAKARIIQLQKDTRAQGDRLADLQGRLQNTEKDLAQNPQANPEEADMLRDIVKRQIRAQKRRVQMKGLILEKIEEYAKGDDSVRGALALFNSQEELELTPQESALIAERKVDDEFFSPVPGTEEERNKANASASRNVAANDRAATRAFSSQRFHAARELFEASLESQPGDVSSLCKLGVVNARLGELMGAEKNFRDAIAMNDTNAFAHRMLGVTLYKMGNIENAKTELEKAVVLDPTDANAHLFLGNIAFRSGKHEVAERQYKEAIQADPTISDSYLNLAILCGRTGRADDGKDYYQQALSNGAEPDVKLEQQLAQ